MQKHTLNPGSSSHEEESETRKFNSVLVESIVEGMEFGEVVLRFIELNSQVSRTEIAEKPEIFASQLEDLLGYGARITMERITRILYAKLGIEFAKTRGWPFSASVKNAFREYLKRAELTIT